jgi:hypothetical protein
MLAHEQFSSIVLQSMIIEGLRLPVGEEEHAPAHD